MLLLLVDVDVIVVIVIVVVVSAGWMRFHDVESDRMFYANLKTRQTSWQRPEEDPFFLEEQIALMFNRYSTVQYSRSGDVIDVIDVITRFSFRHSFIHLLC